MLKTLLANVGSYKKDTLLTPLFVSGEVVMDVIMPLIMAAMIDQGISKGDAGAIMKYGALLFVCGLFALFCGTMGAGSHCLASAGLPEIYAIIFFNEFKFFFCEYRSAFLRLG